MPSKPEPPPASAPPRAREARRWLRSGVQLVLTVVVTAFILDRVGLTLDDVTGIDPGRWSPRLMPLVGSVLVLGAGYVFSAWLWARMVVEMGGPRLTLATAVRVYMVANLGRYVPGKVVQIAGLAWLARGEGVAPGTAMGAAVVGQGVALLGAAVVGLGAFFGPNEAYRWVGWIGVVGATLFVAATSVPASARALEAIWRRLATGSRGGAGALETGTTPPELDAGATPPEADPAARPGFGLRWTGWYALNWGLYAAAFWLLFLGLEGWAPFLQVGPAFAAAYLLGYVAVFAPAGAGIRESALVVFLLPVLPREAALALAVAARVWTTAVELVPAGVLALVQLRRGTALAPGSPSHPPDPASRSSA